MKGLGLMLWALFLCYLFCMPMFWVLIAGYVILFGIYIYKTIIATIENEKEKKRLGKKWYEM